LFLDIPTEQLCICQEKKITQKVDGNIQISTRCLIYCHRFTVSQRSGIQIQNKKPVVLAPAIIKQGEFKLGVN